MNIGQIFEDTMFFLGCVTTAVIIGTFIGLLISGSTLSLKVQIP